MQLFRAFQQNLPPEWFDMMVVEQPRTAWRKGKAIREWIKPNGARNEAWDVSVYNLALAYQLGLHKWSGLDWKRLRDKLIPPTRDMFAPEPSVVVAPQSPTVAQALEVLTPASTPAGLSELSPEIRAPALVMEEPATAQIPVRASVLAPISATAPQAIAAAVPTSSPHPVAPVPQVLTTRAPVGRRILSRGIR